MKYVIGHFRKCDLLTMLSLTLAFLGIILAVYDNFTVSVFLLMLCGICDAFDGVLARSKEYSKEQKCYGIQLDSLTDIVAFGVFPALLTTFLSDSIIGFWGSIIYLLAGLVRLAYFNMLNETNQNKKNKYIGVPITTISIIFPIVFFALKFIDYTLIRKIMPFVMLVMAISFILRVEVPKVDVPKLAKKIFNKYIVNLLFFPLFLVLSADIFFKLTYKNFSLDDITHSIFTNFGAFLNIFVILLLIILILYSIFKTSKKVNIILIIIFLLLMVVNEIKYKIMGLPIEITDVYYLNTDNVGMMGVATGTIGSWIITTIIKSIVFVGLSLSFILFDKHIAIKFSNKLRLIIGASSLTSLLIISNLLFKNPEKTLEELYSLENKEVFTLPKNYKVYYDYGFFQGILLDHLGKKYNEPADYNYNNAKAMLDKKYEDDDSWGKANVVFILSEAFFDVTQIEEIKFDKDLLQNIHTLENENKAIVADLLVNAFGGKSANTEFEILTGANLSFWKDGFIPYNQYYDKNNLSFAPNLIKEFNNNGYETMYITPWGEDSYRSSYIYKNLGVDKKMYDRDLDCEVKGHFCSDEDFFNIIFDELKNTSEDNYKFIMSATAQNHFPFEPAKYDKYDISVTSSSLSNEDTGLMLSYAQGVYDADKALYELYKDIQTLDTPTVVVYFGDHLPYIVNRRGDSSYLNTEYFNDDLRLLKEYTTKGVIFANYDIEMEDLDYLNVSYFGAYVANKLDLELSNYFKFIDYTRKLVPVFNRTNYYDIENDKLKDNTEVQEVLDSYQNVQYMSFYDFR